MSFKSPIRQWLWGSSLPQEYLCVGDNLESPLTVFGTGEDGGFFFEISRDLLFLGYRPLILAAVFKSPSNEAAWMNQQSRISLSFVQHGFNVNDQWQGFATDRASVARLVLNKINTLVLGNETVFFLRGEAGEHAFLSGFHRLTNRVREAVKKRPAGNVDLPGNLFDQVVAAYSIPRTIQMVTAWNGTAMNLFPTDLHGQAGKFYLGSLRIGGKANEQVEETGVIALSKIETNRCRQAYASGRNHMKCLTTPKAFELSEEKSSTGIPLPSGTLSYKLLERAGSMDIGIHRIHYYKILEEKEVAKGIGLAHIHRYYAQWRLDRKMPTAIFFR